MSTERVAVVTGAARGIGRATAIAFARAGYRVAGVDIAAPASSAMDYGPATPEDLVQTGRLVEDAGGEWLPVILDQRDRAAVSEGFAQIVERFGGGEPTGDVEQDERTAADAQRKKLPLGVPWIEPEDVAPLVVFLASEEARMVSGTSFAATGGDSANFTA
ncbi:SDR family NAD(P)-dependent oxidoreductase [Leucobacter sp. CSA1]|uniref:SDR family NAD(P)-dependent oxidoreductase n=1 Tax=Leucobacter chromiisoli TaxID=2796471 RepID=A0A934UV59_9MICO|nr:SDR family NAD(P)-dependent oxidoreductase [Leucobacter chromiisoli]MBK0419121.1 SDR family NAD(P)-dependent oxidoreductase [Leucobacter chromiisoli]